MEGAKVQRTNAVDVIRPPVIHTERQPYLLTNAPTNGATEQTEICLEILPFTKSALLSNLSFSKFGCCKIVACLINKQIVF